MSVARRMSEEQSDAARRAAPGVTPNAETQAQRLDRLEEAVRSWAPRPAPAFAKPVKPAPAPAARPPKRVTRAMVLKSVAAAVVVFAFGWTPLQRLLAITSAEAIVNARVITLRAPIEGEVSAKRGELEIGASFNPGDAILSIANPRADHQHLDNLREAQEKAAQATRSLERRLAILVVRRADLLEQQERFRAGRTAQLGRRMGEIDTQIASAAADHDAAQKALARSKALAERQITPLSALDKAVRDERMTLEAYNGALERKRAAAVELDAARQAVFVGDSYNDTPQSAQREKDVEFDIADTEVRIEGARAEQATLDSDVRREAQRQDERSLAVVNANVQGEVWEVFTAPGEHVNAGQDLVKLLDCDSAIVTAAVSESAYQNLKLGQAATFRPRNGDPVAAGRIVGLNGLASLHSNNAIAQGALSREPYHVTLKFPAIEKTSGCQVGQTGLVTFLDGKTAPAAR